MQTYQNTKPTDIAWLGEVPEHWELRKAKYLFSKMERAVRSDDEIVTCFRNGEVTLRSNRRTEGFTNALKEHGYQGVRKGDLVIHAMDAFAGAIGVSDADGKSTPVYSVCTPRLNNQVNVYFYAYFLRNLALSGFIQSLAKGIRERSTDFRFSDFAQLELPLPPLLEQTAIANFLDKKTAQIKEAIALKSEQIDKLKEYRQTLINQTVTQGLNPTVPMKHGGVQWLGDVPEHWEVKKITHIFRKIGSGTTPTAGLSIYYDNGEINWLQTGDLNDGLISETSKKITPKAIKDFSSLKIYSPNSLVIAMYGATIGKVGLLNIYSTTNQACCVLGDGNNLEIKYIFYFFQAFKEKIVSMGYGGGQPNISQDLIKSLRICLPPLSEQTAIADFLDKKTTQIDTAIRQYQAEIDKLKEYQQSLVNEVVTGKVRVSDLKNNIGA